MHKPAMLFETIKLLDIKSNGLYLDFTFGFGGHSYEILKYLNNDGKLIVCDKDIKSYKKAKKLSKTDNRIKAFHISFNNMYFILNKLKMLKCIDGLLIDLGISLVQIKDNKSGFGFLNNNFLDMRLNIKQIVRIIDWINFANKEDLESIFNLFNDIYLTKIITDTIIIMRKKNYIKTTNDLCNFFFYLFGKNKGQNILSQLFQFMRFFANNDFLLLEKFLKNVIFFTKLDGSVILISFNSLEEHFLKKNIFNNNFLNTILIKPLFKEININLSSRTSNMYVLNKIKF